MTRLRGFAALFAASASHGCPPVRDFYFAYNSVTWSVSLEAMFYLRLPLLLLALRRHWQLILGLVAVWVLTQMGLAVGLQLQDFLPAACLILVLASEEGGLSRGLRWILLVLPGAIS